MGGVSFVFREGTSVLYAGAVVAFALLDLERLGLTETALGMFIVAIVSLVYLAVQMAMAAFTRVGDDRPTVDLFFSFIPLVALITVAVLAYVEFTALSRFQILGLVIAGAVVMMDVVLNTQVLFKINRLATDFVQMR